MKILDTQHLLGAFERRLAGATRLDVAVAWARSGAALDALQAAAKRGVSVRAIVGLAGNHTQPVALRTLAEIGELRIANGQAGQRAPGGIFHPKVFVFHCEGASIGWVGSANLTAGGFIRNYEAVGEVSPADGLTTWFDNLWDTLPKDPMGTLEEYEKGWAPPPSWLDGEFRAKRTRQKPRQRPSRPEIRKGQLSSWSHYLNALSEADRYWRWWSHHGGALPGFSVLGETFSWIDTVETVGSLIRRPRWGEFADSERWVLLGMGRKGGEWGLLGSMGAAGNAKQIFRGANRDDRAVLLRLHNALTDLIAAPSTAAPVDAAVECLERMTQEQGISHGVATRLMACARPDLAVSVNKGSARRLGELTGLPGIDRSLGLPKNYRRLLEWVAAQPWYAAPLPQDPWAARLWAARAALIDSLVYEPV